MACKPIVLEGITPEVLSCLKGKMEKSGLALPEGESGQIKGMGVVADYRYDESKAEMHVQVMEKPFIVSCSFIEGRIRDSVNKCMVPVEGA